MIYQKYEQAYRNLTCPKEADFTKYVVLDFRRGTTAIKLDHGTAEELFQFAVEYVPIHSNAGKKLAVYDGMMTFGVIKVLQELGLEVKAVTNKDGYNAARREYHQKQGQITAQFREALETQYGMSGHPKADKVWAQAWDDGHSSGYSEIECHYQTYADLVL